MSEKTKIEWTDATWPVVQGCEYVSPGCANCYAPKVIHRQALNPNPKLAKPVAGLVAKRNGRLRWTGKVALREDRLDWPLKWKTPSMVFVPSLGDLFHEDVPDEFIDRVFAVMALARRHTFQVLTKRSDRLRAYLTNLQAPYQRPYNPKRVSAIYCDWQRGVKGRIFDLVVKSAEGRAWREGHPNADLCDPDGSGLLQWPLPNVWIGVSVENQRFANARIPDLIQTPAVVHFLSCEPLLGPIDLTMLNMGKHEGQLGAFDQYIDALAATHCDGMGFEKELAEKHRIHWVICGGESAGPAERRLVDGPFTIPGHERWLPSVRGHGWVSSLRDQCVAAGIPWFFKQWGGPRPTSGGRRLDGRVWDEKPEVVRTF